MRETETEIRPAEDAWPTPEGPTLVGTPPPPPVAPPPVAGPPPDRRIGAGMLLAIGAILLVALGVALAWFFTHRNASHHTTTVVVTNAPKTTAASKVAVPRLIGMTKDAAMVRVAQLGLTPKVVYQATKKPKDTVVSQKPQEATELAKGKTVTLVVDSTPTVSTPKTQTTTTSTTTAARQTTTAPTTTAAAAPAQPVQPANATVPDVASRQEAAAVQAMNQAGILASLTWVPGSDELGTVEAQAKPAGTTVPYHSHVQINLSTGPGEKTSEQVPNVVGKTLKDALATINGAHLRMLYLRLPVSSRSQAGKIVQQSPLGGTAPQNAQMLVWLGAYGK